MTFARSAVLAVSVAVAALVPLSEASARCWNNGWGWRCGPGLLALPFVVAGTAVAGAAAIVTAPVRAITGPPYGYYPPGYYPPPGYYYPPRPPATNN
jgi:hypothetical protein